MQSTSLMGDITMNLRCRCLGCARRLRQHRPGGVVGGDFGDHGRGARARVIFTDTERALRRRRLRRASISALFTIVGGVVAVPQRLVDGFGQR